MTYPWNAGDILTAADLNSEFASKVDYAMPANAQSGTGASAYTFVLADATRLTTATGTSAKTFTIPPQASVAWVANSIIRVANYGAGDLTIAGGSGVTVTNATTTLAQFESAAAIRTGSNAWTLVPFSGGGVSNADFSNAATGTYTDSGINYKYITFTSSGTLTVTKAGLAEILVVSGGAGGAGGSGSNFGAGGGSGGANLAEMVLTATTYNVVVGAGGAGGGVSTGGTISNASHFGITAGDSKSRISGGLAAPGPGPAGNGGTSASGYAGGTNSGGGGGATAIGSNGGGNGGAGFASAITGTSVTYAVGGPGGSSGSSIPGGANTGTGGGAGTLGSPGGNGGSGVVIIRVKV